jgi:Ala-tRNA(Pro) deacylase
MADSYLTNVTSIGYRPVRPPMVTVVVFPGPCISEHQSMPKTRHELMARLDQLGIDTTTTDHEAVFTVGESNALHGRLAGGHTKNLFLKDAKDRLWLIVAECHTAIDLKALPKVIGSARLSFGKPELLMEVLGVTPGSVTAFAVLNDQQRRVSVVVDQRLMQYDTINCHPLVNTATTSIQRNDLMKFFAACGHEPRILELSGLEGTAR